MNESQTITVSELGPLDKAELPELSRDDVYRILAAKVRRGRTICVIFCIVTFISTFFAILIFHSTPWAVLSGVACIAFRVWAMLGQQKLELAHRIAVEPGLVYWAHPRRSAVLGFDVFLTLHTRAGQSLEVAMSRDQMLAVVAWFRRHNSELRCGAYDDDK